MNQRSLDAWFEKIKRSVEEGYLSPSEPWRQSGFAGPEERWEKLRRPIVECVDRSGTFLDIGCANGYLLECLLKWTGERGLAIKLYGLDFSEKLVEMAKSRLPEYSANLFVGNAWTWKPPRRFDFVRTELGYVPDERWEEYARRLLEEFVAQGGKLLLAEYRSSKDTGPPKWVDDYVREWGMHLVKCKSGFDTGKELTRITVVSKD